MHSPYFKQDLHEVGQDGQRQLPRGPRSTEPHYNTQLVTPVLTLPQNPFTHGFVMEFESAEDRDYYVSKDPAHQDFIKAAGPKVANVKVLDFEPGKF